jgi:hypothetical protein
MQSGTKEERISREVPNKVTGMASWLSRMHLERFRGDQGPKMFRPVSNSLKSGEHDEKRKS